jgi:hypothetical protein
MTAGPVRSRTADAGLLLPAPGLRLLGGDQGGGAPGHRFLVGRSDGQVVRLSLLPYLVISAIAEGGVDGGWSAGQVGARVGAASGQGLTADGVRCLIAETLAPLGLVTGGAAAADGANTSAAGGPGAGGTPGAARRRWMPGAARRSRRRRWSVALGGAAVLVSIAAAAPMMAGTGRGEPGGARPAAASAASRSQAASWVAREVSPQVTVACDPGLCLLLRRDGFPAARLEPVAPGARGLPGSGMVVVTAAIRGQLGPRLAADAPQVIASFGAGAAQVAVRTIAPGGPAAFGTRLAAEMTALAAVGRQLLGNDNIQASPAARADLRAGQVDARLLALLALLSAQRPVRLVSFAGAPGAGPGVPLRTAALGFSSPAATSAVVALLDAQQGPYRPAVAEGSGSVITLRFDAPAALSMSQP